MKNRRGFTLIEVIGVIIIIGVIALIAIPAFMGSLNVFREDYYDNIVSTLEASGREFFTDNKIYRPSKMLETRTVSLATLELEKYIDDVVDYEGNNCNNESYVVVVRRGRNDYEYAVCLKCEADDYDTTENKYCDEAWKYPTNIKYGLGEIPTIYVYKGTNREELKEKLKVAAWIIKYKKEKDENGNEYDVELDRVDGTGIDEVPEIYPNNIDTIDTNIIGTYPTTYNFNSATRKGTVVVYENTEPGVSIKKKDVNTLANVTGPSTNVGDKYTSNYISGEWSQGVRISLTGHSESGIKITKFQWRIDNRWIDLCDATDEGTCIKTITNEMNEEGIYFRSIDVDGNISQITQNPITIRIDTTIPTCDLITTGTMGDNSWYVDDVTISFNSSKTKDLSGNDPDAISGIAKRIVTLGDVSGSPTAVQTSDTTSITWYGYVEDRAQNYQTCNITFKKDETKPECSFLLNGEKGDNDWYIGNVLVSFANKIDNTSQVASYGIGSLLGSKETTHTLDTANQTYIGYIKDYAGNENTCTVNLKKDSTKPECSLKLDGEMGENDWYVSNVGVSFSKSTDAMSQVASYGINSATGVKSINHKNDTASQTYIGHIRDKAGNENTCTISFKMDTTDPTCTNSGDNSTWTNRDITINYGCNDNLSSCNTSHSGGSEVFNETTKTSTIDSYIIKDQAGNSTTCASRLANVYVDKTNPICTNSGDSTTWTNSSRVIYYGCSDSDSGCNSGGSKTFNSTTTTATIDAYTITDRAGNSTTCASRLANVYVDKTAPSINCSKTNQGTTSGVTVTCTCSDSHSGVSSCAGISYNVTSSSSYSVTDKVGNSDLTNISVTSITETRYRTREWDQCLTGSEKECEGGYKTCANSSCGTYACGNWRYTVSYTCANGSTGKSSSTYMFTTKSNAQTACANNGYGVAFENCVLKDSSSWSCSYSSNKTCNYSCQHKNCGWDDCLTSKNTCSAGWSDYSNWSEWSNSSCSESDETDCDYRTRYE